jgi:NAD(P)-dependent dehydrogenase (short-subunit alcohol dehydrogenase family)
MPRAALVTGAGHRIGRSIALGLAKRGFDVAVHYASSGGTAADAVTEIETTGQRAVALSANLLDDTETASLVPRAVKAVGPLTLLVNNASIFEYDSMSSATHQSWDRHIGSNLKAPFFLTQSFAEQVPGGQIDECGEVQATGMVINMIDQRVRKLTPEFMTYTLAKSALWTLTRTSAQALAPDVRVNAIGPGPTLRGLRQSEDHFRRQREATILKRGADPAGIMRALEYFLDSPSVTGQLLCVDGGQHLAWETPDILGLE